MTELPKTIRWCRMTWTDEGGGYYSAKGCKYTLAIRNHSSRTGMDAMLFFDGVTQVQITARGPSIGAALIKLRFAVRGLWRMFL